MKLRLALVSMMLSGLCVAQARADDQTPVGDPDGSIALAQRMETYAHQILRSDNVPPSAWNQSADLLKAAVKLDPNEPRYARLLVDALLTLDDGPGAIKALQSYIKLNRDDQFAQVQLLDLYLGQMQSADQKIAYLRGIIDKQDLPPEVRSATAVRCAQLLAARLQTSEAIKMLDAALTMDHLNSAAMRERYSLTAPTATRLNRVQQLLNMVMACPTDPIVATWLAEQLADAGLVNQSIQWYSYANSIYSESGIRPDASFALGASSELLIADRIDESSALLSQYVTAVPDDVNGWLMRALAAKYQGDENPADHGIQTATADIMRRASIALTNSLLAIRNQASGDTMATTQPMDAQAAAPLPDLSGDADLLGKSGKPELADQYVASAEALAWYDLYFAHNPASADPVISALQSLLGSQDARVVRLQGWRAFVGGDPVAASTKLVAVQDMDPLAALGMVLIDAADPHKHDEAVVRGKQLLAEHPSGFTGATIYASLHQYDVTLETPPSAESISEAMEAFPMDFLEIVNHPQQFYIIHAEPTQLTYNYGDPVLVRVMIENVGQYDISIGPDAALHPDLWGDASLRGLEIKTYGGAAFDRFEERLELPVGQTITTIMRVDNGPMYDVFKQPFAPLTINMGIITNPSAVTSAGAGEPALGKAGPCGYGVQLSRMILRPPVQASNSDQREALLNQLRDPDGGNRIQTLDVLTNCVQEIRRENTPDSEPIVTRFIEHIRQTMDDPSPSVAAWARFCMEQLTTGDEQTAVISKMQQDEHWQSRMLAMVGQSISGGTGVLATQLSNDSDPLVRDFAVSTSQRYASWNSTTQPTSAAP
jgi:tetratricopeptide (TPR) repeat protein